MHCWHPKQSKIAECLTYNGTPLLRKPGIQTKSSPEYTIWSHFRVSSVSSEENHCCHLTLVSLCPNMATLHIWRSLFSPHVSPLADLNENQLMLKECNIKMTSSFPINLSPPNTLSFSAVKWSDCLFSRWLTTEDTRLGSVTLAKLHHSESVPAYTRPLLTVMRLHGEATRKIHLDENPITGLLFLLTFHINAINRKSLRSLHLFKFS